MSLCLKCLGQQLQLSLHPQEHDCPGFVSYSCEKPLWTVTATGWVKSNGVVLACKVTSMNVQYVQSIS